MSLLPTPVSTPEARSRLSMDRMKKTVTAGIKRSQSVRLPPVATPRSLFTPCGGEPRELLRYSRSTRPFPSMHRKTLSLDVSRSSILLPAFDATIPLPPIPSDVEENVEGTVGASLAQRVELLTSQVNKMQSERNARAATEDALRLEVRNLALERETLRQHVHSLQGVVRSSSRRMNDCVDASASALETERELRREIEARARRAEDRILLLQNENAVLTQSKAKADKEAARCIADAKQWQEKLRAMQDTQALAVKNIRTIEELEEENTELKTAMHAFARGSTDIIVLQLELIIERLRADLTRYKAQQEKLKYKGKENEFRRRDSGVLQEMRKTTQAIKVSSHPGYCESPTDYGNTRRQQHIELP
ncbi:hypothetical protein FOMPIDRAFT_83893 [Fomitopsis schrenkii]|uniref:Uncharacterized protein n=1 Tax=Fomitopsis schrenkii TaxID=2126942 RepID=S8EPH7_FOMSC|nr:hypothetical protein FOMPIDRAFT_83893 [Fomitopsis schrenkii]